MKKECMRELSIDEIFAQDFKPIDCEFIRFRRNTNGRFYGLLGESGEIISALGVYPRRSGGFVISECYTKIERRGHGCMYRLLDWVCNDIYKGCLLFAYCLESSYKIFYRVDFNCHGITVWSGQGKTRYMKRDGEKFPKRFQRGE